MRTIRISGRELPCRVTLGAMLRYKRMTGNDVSQLNTTDVEGLATMLYCCVVSACKADGVEWQEDFESFCDMIEPAQLTGFYEDMGSGADSKKKKKTENL